MNSRDTRYARFALVREMLESAEVVRSFDPSAVEPFIEDMAVGPVLLSGEGSSRIFPAKRAVYDSLRWGYRDTLFTEASTQALEYRLDGASVFVASNSGRTKEGVRLVRTLWAGGHRHIYGVVSHDGTPIAVESRLSYLLACGAENAVAATKSVIEQALFYDVLFRKRNGRALPDFGELGDLLQKTMELSVPEEMASRLASASTLYWAGRNDGVAEELTLKTNEITRKKSDFLEGTYAVHGIEEVMDAAAAVIVVAPWPEEEQKFAEVLEKGVGLALFGVGERPSSLPIFEIPDGGELAPYLRLVAGWNLLVEVGVRLGVDLDKPVRARKVGNEIQEK
ncbi:MAG TPA: sugar isomerase [Spirochaetia bacterium]|nr:sugar isomerase [Spirochaetia bacterium]